MESFLEHVLTSGNININNQYRTCTDSLPLIMLDTYLQYVRKYSAKFQICIGICKRREKFEDTKGLIRNWNHGTPSYKTFTT